MSIALNTLTSAELVAVFNAAVDADTTGTARAVNKFADRATAEKRTAALLERVGLKVAAVVDKAPLLVAVDAPVEAEQSALDAVAQAEPELVEQVKKDHGEKAERKRRGFRFVFPKKDEIKGHRPGTNRAKLIEMMSRPAVLSEDGTTVVRGAGATFEELREATGWDEKTCYEGTRLVHYYLGYGMRQDEEGRITLFR